jgi:hypothetical protein
MGTRLRDTILTSGARLISFAACVACTSSKGTASSAGEEAGVHESGASTGDAAAGSPVDVPITLTQTSSSGTTRFSLPVTLGPAPTVQAFLDTGSSGVRILPGAIPDSAFASITDTTIEASYHSGLVLTGVVAKISVSIGGVQTPAPIPVMLVRSVSCEPTEPNCGAEDVDAADYVFFGTSKVLVGVGLRNSPTSGGVASPMPQLEGSPAFAIQGATFGGTSAILRLRPGEAQIATMKTFMLPVEDGGAPLPNGVPAYGDRYGLPACVNDMTTGVDYCVPAELDTGNPSVYIEWPGVDAGESVLPPSTAVQVVIGPSTAPLEKYMFTVGTTPTPGVDEVVVEPATGAPFMNLGTQVFFRYDVYFDPVHGVVGFAGR